MVYDDVMTFCKVNFRVGKKQFIYDKHKKYLRVGAGFDIETTRKDDKAFMYLWQVSFGGDELYGRTWAAFEMFMTYLQQHLHKINAHLIIWVANLGHEFAFIGRRFHWESVFARESHQPLIARTGKVEFREALVISGQGGLANLAKNYTDIRKAVGDLDFRITRNSMTPIDHTELNYAIIDVRILSKFGEYLFQNYSDKKQTIPTTATRIVYNQIKAAAEETGQYKEIQEAVSELFPDRELYNAIMAYLFRGGYTHANAWWVGVVWSGVIGADYTSSYPSVMLHCYYPKTKFIPCTLQTDGHIITDETIDTMCVWFIAIFRGIKSKTMHSIESEHKIVKYENALFDNGRLRQADFIRVYLTEIDYEIYQMFYDWECIEIQAAFKAVRGKLPEYVLKPLREAYIMKARIKKDCKKKGISPDTIPEYRNAKATINSFYGVMVQRLNFYDWIFDEVTGEWSARMTKKSYDTQIKRMLLSPFWGIYVTAHSRMKLLKILYKLDGDTNIDIDNNVLYCDTDSVYMLDTPRNRAIIEEYNRVLSEVNMIYPPELRDIGLFEWIDTDKETGEPIQYTFKTLGAKRYLKYHDGVAEVTVSGMRKGTLEKSILRTFATDNSYPYHDKTGKKLGYVDIDELFERFSDTCILTSDESERNASIYTPLDYEAEIIDDRGNVEIMHEKSGVAIVPVDFSIRMDEKYKQLLKQIMIERRLPI